MKKALTRILVLVIVITLIASAVWYTFVYDRDTVRDFLSAQARNCAENGHFKAAAWFFDLSYQLSGEDQNVAIELAQIYKDVGNYTKAEYTLVNAIADGGTAELYMALVQTYVEQDKLLDAVTMLDQISDPEIKAQLDAMRPAAPVPDFAAGFYSQYISVTFSETEGSLYVTTDGTYPSTEASPCATSVALPGGETKVYALTVGENGLVSPLTILNYTIGGVIEEVTISDPALDAQIRQQLGVGKDEILFTDDLWSITEFTVPADAKSLDDLAKLTYLQKLTIDGLRIESMAFLASLTNLQELSIHKCMISDSIAPIAKLPVLTRLTLRESRISTISGLEGAPALTTLDLSGNAIGNITPLATIPTLQHLDLSDNAVSGLDALSGLSQLTTLDLSDNAVTSLEPLASVAALTKLDISRNKITFLAPLAGLSKLSELSAAYNLIYDCAPLASCTELTVLDLSHNDLTDLSSLSTLTKVADLDFSYNAVSAAPQLPGDCTLVTINGSYNQLTSLEFLDKIDSLNDVYMDYNPGITTIGFLADNPNLVQVNVYGTAVSTEEANILLYRSIIVNYTPTA